MEMQGHAIIGAGSIFSFNVMAREETVWSVVGLNPVLSSQIEFALQDLSGNLKS